MAFDKVIDSTKLNACLTAEANAIRAKSGGSASISFDYSNDKGFADAIAAIPSGSGGGLPDDGKTRLYISLDDISRPTVTIRFRQSVANGITVDWGDGSTPETYTGTSAADHMHTYSETGVYVISLAVTSGTLYLEGGASACVMGATGSTAKYNLARLRKVEIGNHVTSIGNYAFQYCNALTSITIPDGVTSIGAYVFQYCYALTSVTIPASVTSISGSAFYYCYSLTSITIPASVTRISDSAFYYCYSLTSVTIPDSVTSISDSAFYYCYSLTSVTIPASVTSIDSYAFQRCYGMKYYYLKPQTPPTLANANAFSNIPSDCVMYVPYSADHSILEAYKTASNWSTYASYMQEEPQ